MSVDARIPGDCGIEQQQSKPGECDKKIEIVWITALDIMKKVYNYIIPFKNTLLWDTVKGKLLNATLRKEYGNKIPERRLRIFVP